MIYMTHFEKHKKTKKRKRSKRKIKGAGPKKLSINKQEKLYNDIKLIHENDMGNITEIEAYLDDLTEDESDYGLTETEKRKNLIGSIMEGRHNFLIESRNDSDNSCEKYYDSDIINSYAKFQRHERRKKTSKRKAKSLNNSPHIDTEFLANKNRHNRDKNKNHGFTSVTTLTGFKFSYINCSNIVTEAMILGTKLHKDIEIYYNTGKSNNNTKEFRYFENFLKEEPELIPYRTEWSIYDEDIKLSGTVDMIFKNKDGTYSIYDWKRQVYFTEVDRKRYSLQLNLYKKIIESKYNLKIKGLFLLCLHPNNSNYQIIVIKPEVISDSYITNVIKKRIS